MKYNSLLICLLLSFTSACTQKYQDLTSTIKDTALSFQDVKQSQQKIKSLPYASSYVKIDNAAQVFMVLALAEPSALDPHQTLLKWLSSDSGMIVTENGRLVKTLRLPTDNLNSVTSIKGADPLLLKGQKPDMYSWQARYDWQPNYRFNYTANLTWEFMETRKLHTVSWDKETNYYREKVSIPALNTSFTNYFWLDKTSHNVVKSIQFLGPDMPTIEMTILKPFSG